MKHVRQLGRPRLRRRSRGAGFRGFAFAVSIAAILALTSACRLDMGYDKYAVVFGVADYTDPGVQDLNYTDDDAVAMAALLEDDGYAVWGWDAGGLASGETMNSDATEANFLSVLTAVAADAGEEDLFLFYFSGHGGPIYVSGTEGQSADNQYDEGIFFDTDPISAFTEEELKEALQAIPCLKKIVIIDACYSGGFIGDSGDVDGMPSDYRGLIDGPLAELDSAVSLYFGGVDGEADITPGEAVVLAAAGERELSYEDNPVGSLGFEHGVFTYYLLRAPSAGDGNADGYVTVTEAYDYVRRQIDQHWNSFVYYDDRFAPHVSGGPLDYVLFTGR